MTDETKTELAPPSTLKPVRSRLFCNVLYEAKPQPIKLSHCVRAVGVDSHYGVFSLYDQSLRLLGASKNGTLHLSSGKRETDVANVWYDAIVSHDTETQDLVSRGVKGVGINFSQLTDVTIVFHDAPREENLDEEGRKALFTVPVCYLVDNVWDSEKKKLLY